MGGVSATWLAPVVGGGEWGRSSDTETGQVHMHSEVNGCVIAGRGGMFGDTEESERKRSENREKGDGRCRVPLALGTVTHLLKTAVSVLASTVRLSVSFIEPLETVSVTRSPVGSSSASGAAADAGADAALGPDWTASSGHCSAPVSTRKVQKRAWVSLSSSA